MNATPLHPKALTKLPDMAVYGPGVAGTVKRKSLVTVPPIQGSSFTPTGQRQIQIFLPKNGFFNGVNSYLTFEHSCPQAATGAYEQPCLSTSASNWIQRLRIKVGGRVVEDIDDYNVLHEIVKLTVVNDQFRNSPAGRAEGYEPNTVRKVTEIPNLGVGATYPGSLPQAAPAAGAVWVEPAVPAVADFNVAANVVLPHRYGVKVNMNRTGDLSRLDDPNSIYPSDALNTLQNWAASKQVYAIKLLSGFLEARKYIPLRFMPPVEIEITLADFARSHVWAPARTVLDAAINALDDDVADGQINAGGRYAASAATPINQQTYTISNVNMQCEMLEFDETFYQAFEMSLTQGVTMPFTTFTNHVFSHTGTTADIQVAERVRSAKSLFAVQRRLSDLAYPAYPKFIFAQNNLEQFQVKIGTQYFPLQPLNCYGQVSAGLDKRPAGPNDLGGSMRQLELLKCVSAMADTTHATTFSDVSPHTEFIIGVDLDREFNRLSGLDTTKGLPLFINLRHGGGNNGYSLSGQPCILNVFVHYDMFMDLFPGEVIEVVN